MPRSSCIEHPQRSPYITIWSHYLYMFDGSFPAAALLAALEFLCNGELDRLPDEQPGVIPWFVADVPTIIRTALGMYSARTAQEALKRIEDAGLIAVDRRGLGKPNKYLFRYDRVQKALRKRYIFDGNFAVEEWRSEDVRKTPLSTEEPTEGSSAILPPVLPFIPILLNEDEYEDELPVAPRTSIKPESTDVYEPPVEIPIFVEHVEVKNLGDPSPLPIPQGMGGYPVWVDTLGKVLTEYEAVIDENVQITVYNLNEWLYTVFQLINRTNLTPASKNLRQAMVDHIASLGPDGKEKAVNEIYEYMEEGGRSVDKLIQSWGPAKQTGQKRTDAHSGSRSVYPKSSGSRYPTKAPSSSFKQPYSSDKPQPPEEALRWNVAVPNRKWAIWGGEIHQAMTDRLADPDFRGNYGGILEKCSEIVDVGSTFGPHITLPWLLDGHNWQDLVNGRYDKMLVREKKGRSKEVDTSMDGVVMPEIKRRK